ncbi:hypothetical protein [Burkholderia territorii]|uniref:hypothetical protein n=1 Tax=Burkholderia territorii TaxID=1503055 RepID=UPI001E45E96B|nr:hypothetical protein [Burkholderia territorii]
MASVEQRLHGLHQFVQVEAGREDLVILQVEVVGIRQHNQHVGGMSAARGNAEGGCNGEPPDRIHGFLHREISGLS